MKNGLILFAVALLAFVSCNLDNEPPGRIRELKLEKDHVLFSYAKDTAIVKIQGGWAIGGILISNNNSEEPILYENNSYIKEYEDGSRINHLCDTMIYEWVELIKLSPDELKIVVQENISTERALTVYLAGGVGYFSENMPIMQKSKE